jgi:hypothetical protein
LLRNYLAFVRAMHAIHYVSVSTYMCCARDMI